MLAEIGKDPLSARRTYREFVEEGLDGKVVSPLKEVVEKVLLGSAEWVEAMRRALGDSPGHPNIAESKQLAWRPSIEEIEIAVAEEFRVDLDDLFVQRVKNNEARSAALYLIRGLTSVSTTRLADRYGGVSQPAISKAVRRAATRRDEERRWKQRLARLEKSLRSAGASK